MLFSISFTKKKDNIPTWKKTSLYSFYFAILRALRKSSRKSRHFPRNILSHLQPRVCNLTTPENVLELLSVQIVDEAAGVVYLTSRLLELKLRVADLPAFHGHPDYIKASELDTYGQGWRYLVFDLKGWIKLSQEGKSLVLAM